MWGIKKLSKAKSQLSKKYIMERRGEKEDRRLFGTPTRFPFIDSDGKFVKVDRRSMPDRRLANIQVKEDHLNLDKSRITK